jgi:GT2 family glycosyltransferase
LIFLLNSDVKLSADYFEYQWKYFSLQDTFGVMGRIVDMEGDNMQDTARALRLSGFKLKTDFFYSSSPGALVPTIYLSGANALIDAKKLKSIGGFDEIFCPFYGEDLDLGLRAWRLGWKCYYEHQSICRHEVSASTKNYKTANWVKTVYFRNRFYVHAIHLSGVLKAMWVSQILVDIASKVLSGQYWMYNSYKALFQNKEAIRSSRKRLKTLMQAHNSNRTIKQVISEFNEMLTGMEVKWLKD